MRFVGFKLQLQIGSIDAMFVCDIQEVINFTLATTKDSPPYSHSKQIVLGGFCMDRFFECNFLSGIPPTSTSILYEEGFFLYAITINDSKYVQTFKAS